MKSDQTEIILNAIKEGLLKLKEKYPEHMIENINVDITRNILVNEPPIKWTVKINIKDLVNNV